MCRERTHLIIAQMYTANIMSLFLAAKLRTRSSLLRLGRRLTISWRRNIILLLAGSFSSRTSFKYSTIYCIFPSRPFKACTFWKMLLSSEFRGISLISLRRCSTPISSGSVASTFDSMWKKDLRTDPVFGLTSSWVMKTCVGSPSSFWISLFLHCARHRQPRIWACRCTS